MTVQVVSPVALENLRSELRWLGYSVYKDCDCDCVTARTLRREVAFLAANDGFVFLASSSL